MFGNGNQVQTHSGNIFIDAELVYRHAQMLDSARDAGQARQARIARTTTRAAHGPRGVGRLRGVFHRPSARTPTAR